MRATECFSPNSDMLILGPTGKNGLTCYDSANRKAIRSITTRTEWGCFKYHPNGDYIVVGEINGFSVWSPDLSQLLWTGTLPINEAGFIIGIDFSLDGMILAILSRQGAISFWDLQTHQKLFSVPTRTEHCVWMRFVAPNKLQWAEFSHTALFNLGFPDSIAITNSSIAK